MVCVRGISEALGVTRAWLLLVKLGGGIPLPDCLLFCVLSISFFSWLSSE